MFKFLTRNRPTPSAMDYEQMQKQYRLYQQYFNRTYKYVPKDKWDEIDAQVREDMDLISN